MSTENLLWGAPRIHGELLKLGFSVAQSSVARYMVKRRGPPGQEWRTFLRNHAPDIAAMDLFVVPTIGFKLLYGFVIIRLDRRDLVRIGVTTNPDGGVGWADQSKPPVFSAFDALAIDDGGGGTGSPANRFAAFYITLMMYEIEHAILTPQVEIIVERRARRQVFRDGPPLTTGGENVHDNLAHNDRAFVVGEVAGITQWLRSYRARFSFVDIGGPSESGHLP